MNNQIMIVTSPDDVLIPAKRITTVDLTLDQSQILSDILKKINFRQDLVLYVWNNSDSEEWLIDKTLKSDLIIANSLTLNQAVFGFLLSNNKTHYFEFSSLSFINKNQIHSNDLLAKLLEEFFNI